MCGIWAIFGLPEGDCCYEAFKKISHRGPDSWRFEYDKRLKNSFLGFHRLTIVDGKYGVQPMRLYKYPETQLLCNGELYNCKRLGEEFGFKYETASDVECILHLYKEYGVEKTVRNLDGVFAFCLVDFGTKRVVLARDPYGVRPMFRLRTADGVLAVCSEAKGLMAVEGLIKGSERIFEPFLPGTFEEYELFDDGRAKLLNSGRFHPAGEKPGFTPFVPYEALTEDISANIRTLLTSAVKKRLMAERRLGCLLSGGLDSSLIAALVVKLVKEANLPYQVQTFSVGMGDSPDIIAAREVAKHIGSDHHEIIFTEDDVAKCLDDVIYHLESPDITTIRSSVGMYLLSKYIKENTDSTVIFSGEGADEVAQGYIYYRDAPNADEALRDSKRLLHEIFLFDGLRIDRTIACHNLEMRVPFLDQQFVYYYLNLPKELIRPRDGVEKFLIRSAFDGTGLLPESILWRHKEAFSDGLTSRKKTLFQILQEIVEMRMPEQFNKQAAAKKYPHCSPISKESLYYREIFEKSFPRLASSFIPYFWMPRWLDVTDPSARFIKHYNANTEVNVKA